MGSPYGPAGYSPYKPGPSAIPELLIRQGEAQANRAARSGELLGNAVAGIGQQVGGALQQRAEQQKLNKRDAALTTVISSWDGKDPQALLTGLVKVAGHQVGPRLAEAVMGFQQMKGKADEQELAHFQTVAKAWPDLSPEMKAQFYPAIRQKSGPVVERYFGVKPDQLPETVTPEVDQTMTAWAKAWGSTPKTREITTTNADGSKTTEIVEDKPGLTRTSAAPPKPPETRGIEAQMADAAMRGDQSAYQKLLRVKRDSEMAGRAPVRPNLERVDEVGPDGKARVRFVVPKEGDTFVKPTGAAKPASGQQRRALSFFNRGKEAQDIASALEEGGKIDPTSIKYIPDFANVLQSDSNQSYIQAQRAFTEARLRKESGAAIAKSEYEKDSLTYFVQPGDGPAVKAQKRAMRNAVLAGIALESGDALQEFYGEEAVGMIEGYKKLSKPGASNSGGLKPEEESLLKKYGY